MLTCCFDGAGKEKDTSGNTDVVVVAGFGSMAGVWREFDEKWTARLTKDGLTAFHAVDFAQFRGEFRDGWRADESRRRTLTADLMEIIIEDGLMKFGTIVPVGAYRAIDTNLRADIRLDAYVTGAICAVGDLNFYALEHGMGRNVRYVFEKGDSEGALRERLRNDGFGDPDFTWKSPRVDRKGIRHDGFVGLQAADWIAYEYYLDAGRFFAGEVEDRWAFTQFETLPGRIHAQTAETAKLNEGILRGKQLIVNPRGKKRA
jgi:hypothetical protein